MRRRGRFTGYALAALPAAATALSCTDGSVGPAAYVQDPGFLTVGWTGPEAGRGTGVLLELEGPGVGTVRAPGFELYESTAPGRHRLVVARSLRAGPLVQTAEWTVRGIQGIRRAREHVEGADAAHGTGPPPATADGLFGRR